MILGRDDSSVWPQFLLEKKKKKKEADNTTRDYKVPVLHRSYDYSLPTYCVGHWTEMGNRDSHRSIGEGLAQDSTVGL